MFLCTEEGVDWLDVQKRSIESWADFLTFCNVFDEHLPTAFENGTPIQTLVIDTIDILCRMCSDHVCGMLGIGSLADLEWGKGWQALGAELERVLVRMSKWPYGLCFISHSREKEVKAKASKIDRIEPSMVATGAKLITSMCDIILYAHMNEYAVVDDDGGLTGEIREERMLRCHPQANVTAGDRTGYLPALLPLDYTALAACFQDTKEQTEKQDDE